MLRPHFLFVLKGRSYHKAVWQTLGYICSCCRLTSGRSPTHTGGKLSLQGQIPPQPGTLLFNSPGSPLRHLFLSKTIFPSPFFTPRPLAAEKFPSSLHLDSCIKLIQRLTEGTGKGCSWLGVTAGHEGGGFRFHQVLHNAEGTT